MRDYFREGLPPEFTAEQAEVILAAFRRVGNSASRALTYVEIVEALRLAKRMGDCVPDDIEGTAKTIFSSQVRESFHVMVRDAEGRVIDPASK
jgi:hypothetical protein